MQALRDQTQLILIMMDTVRRLPTILGGILIVFQQTATQLNACAHPMKSFMSIEMVWGTKL